MTIFLRSAPVILLLSIAGQTPAVVEPIDVETLFGAKFTNAASLVPSPYEREIVASVGDLLEKAHYRGQVLDDDVSSRFLDRYLDALDPQHLYFLQSDLDEFERYRFELDNLIQEDGDSMPARVIFKKFRQRVDQHYDFVRKELQNELQFDTEERYLVNRREQPRPKTDEEAKKLWQDRLRYEYLQEKLSMPQPDAITSVIREKLEQKKNDELHEALTDKLGKEKLEAVLALVQETSSSGTVDDVIRAVETKLAHDNKEQIIKTIARRYNRVLRSIYEYENDEVLQLYLTSLAHVYDPHSDYMGHAALENFSIGMKLSLFGIGALLQSEDGYCKIVSLTPNGPAEKSNQLKPNDKIIAVAQGEEEAVDVVDMKLSKVVDLIRGAKGTEVRLTVVPADAADPSVRKTVTLTRDEIKLEDQEAKATIFELPVSDSKEPNRIGVIDLPSFYSSFELSGRKPEAPPKSTTLDVARLIKKLVEERVSGIVLDLRRNGGGSLEEAIKLTGLFLKEGPVVQVQDPTEKVFVENDPDPRIFYRGPLIVLTSRFSASASEILAGALQDYGRALVVGDTSTHGKGTVQSLLQLGPILRNRLPSDLDPGALKITIRKFYRASGASTQLKGVQPDIVLPSINNHADVGEDSLDNALPWDTIEPASFEKLNWVEPFLEEMRRRSDLRVSLDRDFEFIREEIDRYKKSLEDKSISLNEAQRIKEKNEADARQKARRKELSSRPEPAGKFYEIMLEDVEKPGLPEPGVRKKKAKPSLEDAEAEAEEETEEETPRVDITLEETKRILMDLIELTAKSLQVTTAAKAQTTTDVVKP